MCGFCLSLCLKNTLHKSYVEFKVLRDKQMSAQLSTLTADAFCSAQKNPSRSHVWCFCLSISQVKISKAEADVEFKLSIYERMSAQTLCLHNECFLFCSKIIIHPIMCGVSVSLFQKVNLWKRMLGSKFRSAKGHVMSAQNHLVCLYVWCFCRSLSVLKVKNFEG